MLVVQWAFWTATLVAKHAFWLKAGYMRGGQEEEEKEEKEEEEVEAND